MFLRKDTRHGEKPAIQQKGRVGCLQRLNGGIGRFRARHPEDNAMVLRCVIVDRHQVGEALAQACGTIGLAACNDDARAFARTLERLGDP